MGRAVLFITITVFIYSCCGKSKSPQKEPTGKLKEIRLVVKPDSIITKISEIASDIEYIPLYSSGKTTIKAVDKIISNDNKIYFSLCTDILCFETRSRYINCLYCNGNIDKEHNVWIDNFAVDSADTSLIVLSENNLLYFKDSGSGFSYVKTINLGNLHHSLIDFVPGTNKILVSSSRKRGFESAIHFLIDLNGDTLSFKPNYFKRFNPVNNGIRDKIFHYRFDAKLYVKERFNDTIFALNNGSDSFKPEFILSSRLTSTNSLNLNDPAYFKILPEVNQLFETSGFIYYCFNYAGGDHKVFYNKLENKRYEVDPVRGVLSDDIGGGPDFEPDFCYGGKMYFMIYPQVLRRYIESKAFSNSIVLDQEKKKNLKKMTSSLKDSNNPVLISIKLKN